MRQPGEYVQVCQGFARHSPAISSCDRERGAAPLDPSMGTFELARRAGLVGDVRPDRRHRSHLHPMRKQAAILPSATAATNSVGLAGPTFF